MGILNMFERFRDTVILKEDYELQEKVKYLEEIYSKDPNNKAIQDQLNIARKGLKGENEILYQLKKANIGMYVLHNINIEYEDLKAQIDFVVITPWACYFIECKNLIGNITVNDKGDFIRDYVLDGKKIRKGMESPYRQVCAQRDVYKKIWVQIQGKLKTILFERNFDDLHRVLVVAANGEGILNTTYAPKDMKYNVVKADNLIRKLEYDRDHSNKDYWDSKNEIEKWAKHFLKLNVPKKYDFKNIPEEHSNQKEQITEKINISDKNEELKNELIEFRKKRSKEKNVPAYYVFTNEELEKIVELRPKTLDELERSNILVKIKVISHGKEIIEIINKVK